MIHIQTAPFVEYQEISLREYESREFELTGEEEEFLRTEFDKKLKVAPAFTPGFYTLEATEHVGFIVLPTGRCVEIRPKVHIDTLFYLMAKSYKFPELLRQEVSFSSVEELFEFVVDRFAKEVEDLVARGILRGFVPMEEELVALRGKIMISETIRRQPVLRDRHWCAFTEFTSDVPENRILKLTCDTLLAYHYKRIPDLSSRFRRLMRTFGEVTFDLFAAEYFDRLVIHRQNEHYSPALNLARLLLSFLFPSGARGPRRYFAFLVDMNKLFEGYVSIILEEDAKQREDMRVELQKENKLDFNKQLKVKPDIILKQDNKPILVLEVKYKLGKENSDIYQVLAYCHALQLSKAVLIYPTSECNVEVRYAIKPVSTEKEVEVVKLPIDLSGGVEDLLKQEDIFLEAVWGEVTRLYIAT